MANFSRTIKASQRFSLTGDVSLSPRGSDPSSKVGLRVQNSLKGSIPDIMNRLRAALDNALEAAVWQTSKGAADIVDTGALKRSLTMTSTPDGIEISYRAPYASLVHYGGYVLPYGNTNADKVYIPPRPWLQSVMQGGGPVVQFNLEAVLREAISTALS